MTEYNVTEFGKPSPLGLTRDEVQLRAFETIVDAYKHTARCQHITSDNDFRNFMCDMTELMSRAYQVTGFVR